MTYAVIQLAGKQYKVSPGETITVNKLDYPEGEKFSITDVLLTSTDKGITVGTPLVPKVTVTAQVQSQQKGEKIRVATYKSKSRSRKVQGHRQLESVVSIIDIQVK